MEGNERTDEEVVRQVTEGDTDAFGILVERYQPKLARYAKRFLFDRSDTDDLLQEIFIRAYRNIRSFDLARRFSPWIYRIAHNEFVNALKRRDRAPLSFLDPDILFPSIAAEETADSEAIANELREGLDRHLKRLDAKYREVLILYFFEELDYKEIAEILKVPISTVGVRLTRGKALLKKAITGETK
jgi:RNA polymerase sigma-70 factor, ECF subfamily